LLPWALPAKNKKRCRLFTLQRSQQALIIPDMPKNKQPATQMETAAMHVPWTAVSISVTV